MTHELLSEPRLCSLPWGENKSQEQPPSSPPECVKAHWGGRGHM